MKETLRRLCVFGLYVAVFIRFFSWNGTEGIIDDLIELELAGYIAVIVIIIIIAVVHKGINWIFQKGESKDTD